MHQQTQSQLASYAPVLETLNIDELQSLTPAQQFFQKRTITFVVPGKKKRKHKFVPLIHCWKSVKKTDVEILQEFVEKTKEK